MSSPSITDWIVAIATVAAAASFAAMVAARAATLAARQSKKAAELASEQVNLQKRQFEDIWFGARLEIHCHGVAGKSDEDVERVYMKFRVQNTTPSRLAKNCRAYLTELHKVSSTRVLISENLTPDSFQLPWAGHDFGVRDIPAGVAQYVDFVHFSKQSSGWEFWTKPDFYNSLTKHKEYRGTFRFTVMVAGEGATSQTKQIFVDYNGDWKSATPYELS